jgi:UDP-N-acetylglucosamine acyltransferase
VPDGNDIHPTAIIGPGVELGRDNVVAPYAVVLGPCRIGDRNWIGPHVAIGTPAQIRGGAHIASWEAPDDPPGVVIGDDNIIREFVTIHQPTEDTTAIGNHCYLMSYAHVPHDATLSDGVTLSNAAQIGGHAQFGAGANIGLGAMVHQRAIIGAGAMIGMGAIVTKDIPPFAVAYGNPARVAGVNAVGLRRAGYDEGVIEAVARHLNDGIAMSSLPELPAQIVTAFDDHTAAVRRVGQGR